jgi:hypothetical protein
MQDIQSGLEQAQSENKLLLLVMGAVWCHDSTGLAERFEDEALSTILADNYHTVFIDVGYLNDLRHITQRFEQAHYFATPTVMIINPQTQHLLNAKDMHIWGAADSLPLTKYQSYFKRYASSQQTPYRPLPMQHKALVEAFEKTNAQRLNAAYALLKPGLIADINKSQESDLFITQWLEIRQYRMTLQRDIQAIRENALNNPKQALALPIYPPFSWEN